MTLLDRVEALEPSPLRAAGVGIRLAAMTLAVALLAGAIWFVFGRPAAEHRAAIRADAASKAATSAVDGAKDAVATGDRVEVVHDRIERTTHDNTVKIMAAPGADTAVSADVGAAFMRALCLRDAYRDGPACVGLPGAPKPAGDRPDAGDGDPAGPHGG